MYRHLCALVIALAPLPAAALHVDYTYTSPVDQNGQPFFVTAIANNGTMLGRSASGAGVMIAGVAAYYPACQTLTGINDAGLATGSAASYHGYCFVDTHTGTVTSYPVGKQVGHHFDYYTTIIVGIDGAGNAIGHSTLRGTSAITANGASYRLFQVAPYGVTYPVAINMSGTFVGAFGSTKYLPGFISNGSTTTTDIHMNFAGINVAGVAVGLTTGTHRGGAAAIYYNGMIENIAPPHAYSSDGRAIRADGEIAGMLRHGSQSTTKGFVRHVDGTYQILEPVPGEDVTVAGIANDGTVFGTVTPHGGGATAPFLATPRIAAGQ